MTRTIPFPCLQLAIDTLFAPPDSKWIDGYDRAVDVTSLHSYPISQHQLNLSDSSITQSSGKLYVSASTQCVRLSISSPHTGGRDRQYVDENGAGAAMTYGAGGAGVATTGM